MMVPTAAVIAATVLLAVATVTDLRSRRIPNLITYPVIMVAPILAVMEDGSLGLASAGLALAVTTVPFFLLFATFGGIGGGDVKLLAGLALLLRHPDAFDVLFFGLVVAVGFLVARYAVVGMKVASRSRSVVAGGVVEPEDVRLSRVVAFAPCLAAGFVWLQAAKSFGMITPSIFF